ncbi:hypothetical protein [Borrelia sp. RT5S]|uniref:hypothetical protein n=1 Tax=Borrelia sp. RT5S TaxID=2898581 RepID=UPI001E39B160|nr:hypothetical protein [Borrelia sp. RT5S]UGQ16754.1 hypothetical protein LSO06_05385 [Borrelia sp. RT5S]
MKGEIVDKDCEPSGVRSALFDCINISEVYMDIYDVQRECLRELLGDGDLQRENTISQMSSLDLDMFGGISEIEDERGVLRIIRNEDQTINICFKGKIEE